MKTVLATALVLVVAATGAMAGQSKIATKTAKKYAGYSSAAGSCSISVKRHQNQGHFWSVNTNCRTLDGANQNGIFVFRTDQLFALENSNGNLYIDQHHPIMHEYRERRGWTEDGIIDNPTKPICFVCSGWGGAFPA